MGGHALWAGRTSRRRRAAQAFVALAVAAVPLVVAVPAAFAGVGLSVTPSFPTNVTVGQTGLPASLQIVNNSTPPDSTANVFFSSILLVPTCGTSVSVGTGDCPAAQADPGVFKLGTSATGEVGTGCAGILFSIATADAATGQVVFSAGGPPLFLGPPGTPAATCRIDFTFDVLKEPTKSAGVVGPTSLQTAQIGYASGYSSLTGTPGAGAGSSLVTVSKAQPGITTSATATAKVGSPVSDTATLSAANPPGPAPTGTISFSLFGPNNATCTGTAAFTSAPVPVTGTGTFTSAPFTPTTAGTYLWVAAYSGDANNGPASDACGAPNESVVVTGSTVLALTNAPITGPENAGATLGPIVIVLHDTLGNPVPAPAGGVVVGVASSSPGAIFAAFSGGPSITSIKIPSGHSAIQVFYGDSDPGHPVITVTSPGLTTATQTETITPITLGAVVGGTSNAFTIVYTDTSGAAVQLGMLTTTNPVFVVETNSCSNAKLPVGASCRARVVFKPTTTGTQTGQLVIPSSGGTVRLDLVGNA